VTETWFTMRNSANCQGIRELVSQSWRKASNAPFITRPLVDEETMRSSHWLGTVLGVFFGALTLWLGERKGIRLLKICIQKVIQMEK